MTTETEITNDRLQRLAELASDAKPLNDDEWGSDRQITAQDRFCAMVEQIVSKETFSEYEGYCLKATTDEMIEEGLRISRAALGAA